MLKIWTKLRRQWRLQGLENSQRIQRRSGIEHAKTLDLRKTQIDSSRLWCSNLRKTADTRAWRHVQDLKKTETIKAVTSPMQNSTKRTQRTENNKKLWCQYTRKKKTNKSKQKHKEPRKTRPCENWNSCKLFLSKRTAIQYTYITYKWNKQRVWREALEKKQKPSERKPSDRKPSDRKPSDRKPSERYALRNAKRY